MGTPSSAAVDAYDASLVRHTPTAMSKARLGYAGTSVGEYALFGGGMSYADYENYVESIVDAYDGTLVRISAPAFTEKSALKAAASTDSYAIFIGGIRDADNTDSTSAYAYDGGLVKTELAQTGIVSGASSAVLGSYAIFVGLDGAALRYDSNLVREDMQGLSNSRGAAASATIEGYALFYAGANARASGPTLWTTPPPGPYYDSVDAYSI